MTDKQFYILLGEALASSDRDEFVSDYALSSLWEIDPEDDTDEAVMERAVLCGRIYDLAHLSIADIRAATGLSQVRFAIRFCIPRRTIEDWERGARECPTYVRLMLARLCGLAEGVLP